MRVDDATRPCGVALDCTQLGCTDKMAAWTKLAFVNWLTGNQWVSIVALAVTLADNWRP